METNETSGKPIKVDENLFYYSTQRLLREVLKELVIKKAKQNYQTSKYDI